MVDVSLSEEEQVEALKKWWKENGRSLVIGVVLGLGAVFGWQAWNQHQKSTADLASSRFEQLTLAVSNGSTESAIKQAESLMKDFKGTAYGTFAALELAKLKFDEGDFVAAEAQLRGVLDNADNRSIRQIAKLRLARLLYDIGRLDEIEALMNQGESDSFQGEFAELQGDVARMKGNMQLAREAYQEALNKGVSNASLVQMKLDDLSPVL